MAMTTTHYSARQHARCSTTRRFYVGVNSASGIIRSQRPVSSENASQAKTSNSVVTPPTEAPLRFPSAASL